MTAREIDTAIKEAVDVAYARAREVLVRNRDVLENGASELLARETLDEPALKQLFTSVRRGPEAVAPKAAEG